MPYPGRRRSFNCPSAGRKNSPGRGLILADWPGWAYVRTGWCRRPVVCAFPECSLNTPGVVLGYFLVARLKPFLRSRTPRAVFAWVNGKSLVMTKTQSLVVATDGFFTVAEAMMALQRMLDDSLAGTLSLLEEEGSRLWSIESGTHAVTSIPAVVPSASAQPVRHPMVQYVASAIVLITYQEAGDA